VRDWWQPGLTLRTAPLLPLCLLFGAVATLRRALYRSGLIRATRLPVPVIVVGNLTVGGAGKTPLTIALVEALKERGCRPGVISRGYGTDNSTPREVRADSSPAQTGDEPLLIRRSTGVPVFVCRDRPGAGAALLTAYPDTNVILSDDGLQHYALARDAEIAVFDARGAGNGYLLPAGPLREPLSRKVDAVVLNGDGASPVQGTAWRMRLEPRGLYRLDDPALRCLASDFVRDAEGTVAAVAGIGDPKRFFATLRRLGLRIEEHPFPDHHPYTEADLKAIIAPRIVMTEKDAIKCGSLRDPRVWVLPVKAALDDGLIDALLEKIRGPKAA
jgi:tetraacyldisaccharide 4'-kinase